MWTTPVTSASAAPDGGGVRRVADGEGRSGLLDAIARAGGDVEPDHLRSIGAEALADGPADEAARAGDGDAGALEVH